MSRSSLARPILLLTLLLASLPAVAQSSAPAFTITTSTVSLSPTGTGSIPYTLTSVNGYIGTVVLQCAAPVVPAGVRIPYCVGPAPTPTNPHPTTFALAANQVVTGSFSLNDNNVAASAGFTASHNPALAILVIVALLSGLTLRRRTARRLTLPLFLAVFATLSFTTGCGNIPHGFTPGTYTYVVSATQSPVPLSLSANTTVAIH